MSRRKTLEPVGPGRIDDQLCHRERCLFQLLTLGRATEELKCDEGGKRLAVHRMKWPDRLLRDLTKHLRRLSFDAAKRPFEDVPTLGMALDGVVVVLDRGACYALREPVISGEINDPQQSVLGETFEVEPWDDVVPSRRSWGAHGGRSRSAASFVRLNDGLRNSTTGADRVAVLAGPRPDGREVNGPAVRPRSA